MKLTEIIKIILLGIIEGITEWLPVSSTGHMLLFDAVWALSFEKQFKDVFLYCIQFGAVLAVLVFFWKKLCPIKMNGAGMRSTKKWTVDKGILHLWGKVLVACLPSLVGIFVDIPENPLVIALALIGYGIAFIVVENQNKRRTFSVQSTDDISYKQAFCIGLFQVLAIIPGTSRSGATILGALLLGISRPAGAEFTFFMAIPTMAGASVIKILLYLIEDGAFSAPQIGYLLIGMAVAFAVSTFAIRFLMRFVQKHDFKPFGWYRIALGALVIFFIVLPSFLR